MRAASSRLNPAAAAIEDAQTDIREIVKRAFLYGVPKRRTGIAVSGAINRAKKQIGIARLRDDTDISLWRFANAQRRMWEAIGFPPEIILLLGRYAEIGFTAFGRTSARITHALENAGFGSVKVTDMGVPLSRYYSDVWRNRVKPVLDRLCNSVALDPNDYTGRNSLRNLAEMEVRYNDHQESIEALKAAGERFVVCSAHADCSDRCAPWQGRVYSLDGTSGVIDGHRYVPLEQATDIYYTTKAGRVYKNGLLGFNCRHKLYPYRGELLPVISAEERKAEYDVTKRQRAMEREVRKAKVAALMLKDIDKAEYIRQRNKARTLYREYIRYSMDNNRAFYPMRVAI